MVVWFATSGLDHRILFTGLTIYHYSTFRTVDIDQSHSAMSYTLSGALPPASALITSSCHTVRIYHLRRFRYQSSRFGPRDLFTCIIDIGV